LVQVSSSSLLGVSTARSSSLMPPSAMRLDASSTKGSSSGPVGDASGRPRQNSRRVRDSLHRSFAARKAPTHARVSGLSRMLSRAAAAVLALFRLEALRVDAMSGHSVCPLWPGGRELLLCHDCHDGDGDADGRASQESVGFQRDTITCPSTLSAHGHWAQLRAKNNDPKQLGARRRRKSQTERKRPVVSTGQRTDNSRRRDRQGTNTTLTAGPGGGKIEPASATANFELSYEGERCSGAPSRNNGTPFARLLYRRPTTSTMSTTHDWDKPRHWGSYAPTKGKPEYLTVDDGTHIIRSTYDGQYRLKSKVSYIVSEAQDKLLKRDHERLEVVQREFPFGLTMCPYHPELLPHYQYFAETVKSTDGLKVLKIANHHLPNEGYFLTELLPAIALKENLQTLELSHCGLAKSDMMAIISYLAENETLHAINMSSNCFDLEATLALAAAIRNHPILYEIDLSACNLGDGNVDALGKLLVACKDCDVLTLGHDSFSADEIAMISKFLGKKIGISTFCLTNVSVNKEGKGLLTNATGKKQVNHGLILADFLSANPSLVALNLSRNKIRVKAANVIIPALKENTTLEHLDLSRNSLNNSVAPVVVDLLKANTTLLTLDISGNKSMTIKSTGKKYTRWGWSWQREDVPVVVGAKMEIVRDALFDTTNLASLTGSNHTCAVHMSGMNRAGNYELAIRRINCMDASEGKKIRYKMVLALTMPDDEGKVGKKLFNVRAIDHVPLEIMPKLFEMLHQRIGHNGFGEGITSLTEGEWDPLFNLTKVKMEEEVKAEAAQSLKQKKKPKRKRRRRHDDDDDSDDEDWKPSAGLKPKKRLVVEQGRFASRSVYKVDVADKPTRKSERLS
ncbi:hypothetical protein THAOC_14306, partial [Thalassiosira oceanica]